MPARGQNKANPGGGKFYFISHLRRQSHQQQLGQLNSTQLDHVGAQMLVDQPSEQGYNSISLLQLFCLRNAATKSWRLSSARLQERAHARRPIRMKPAPILL